MDPFEIDNAYRIQSWVSFKQVTHITQWRFEINFHKSTLQPVMILKYTN